MSLQSEVEQIVVSLVGNGVSYQAMLDQAMAATNTFASTTDNLSAAEERVNRLLSDGAQVTNSARTATERYNDELAHLNTLLATGSISAETYQRSTDRLSGAEERVNRQLAEGAQVTNSVRTATERYNIELANLNSLLTAGAINTETHERATQALNTTYGQGRTALQTYSSSLQSVGMQLVMVGGAIAGVTASISNAAARSAGEFEQTTIAFETMLGSASETAKLLADITEFAALTPFEMPEIEQATRGLVQFGERGEKLMTTLNNLGNAAAGTSTPFGMVALVFNQIRGVGKLLTQDFRQLSTRGILAADDIAKHFKVSRSQAMAMISAGKVSFEDVEAIFAGLSAKGGRFANLMKKQSESYLGLMSTLSDNVNITMRAFGTAMIPIIKPVVKVINEFVEWLASIPGWVKTGIGAVLILVSSLASLLVTIGGIMLTVGSLTALWGTVSAAVAGFIAVSGGLVVVLGVLAIAFIKLAIVAAIAYVVILAVSKFAKMIMLTEQHNKALERTILLNKQLAKINNARTTKTVEKGNKIEGIRERRDFFKEELRLAEVHAAQLVVNKENTEKALAKAQQNVTGTFGGHSYAETEKIAIATSNLEEVEASSKRAESAVIMLQEAFDKVQLPTPDEAAMTAAEESASSTIASLKDQSDALGKTTRQIEIMKMVEAGYTQQAAENATALIEVYEKKIKIFEKEEAVKQKAKDLEASITSMTEGLQHTIATFQMTSSEAEFFAMRTQGATDAQLWFAEGLTDVVKKLEEQKVLTEKGKTLMEQYASPQKKFAKGLKELDALLGSNSIDIDTYNKALKDLRQETLKEFSIDFSVTGVDAVEAGTADALARMKEFQSGAAGGANIALDTMNTSNTLSLDPERDRQPQDIYGSSGGVKQIDDSQKYLERISNGIKELVNSDKKTSTLKIEKAGIIT